MIQKKQFEISEPMLDIQSSVNEIKTYLLELQDRICDMLKQEDPALTCTEAIWQHDEGGGGRSRILNSEDIIEKAGVNFSHVTGRRLPAAASAKRPELAGALFEALGISVVIHPKNPYAPTSHMNVRFISVEKKNEPPFWWFGGGFDLTPYYGFTEDCIHWHQTAKAACDIFSHDFYAKYKTWCDDYFFLKHRQEPRGIGGIFFDDLNEDGFEPCFRFMKSVGDHYIKAYQPILAKRKLMPYGEKERLFQLHRRGRYVEFNLLYDRGTLFGLQFGGRTESILVSLPPLVSWTSEPHYEKNSPEANLYESFLKPREWI